ncbi:uncharacterized protein LOC136771901 [Amia ocellicauda]|uniref:uncharacterized protein LOC136771901 n=1 Tax=Amia ocellicauda TaxID=2972642 RepID=UPI003464BF17
MEGLSQAALSLLLSLTTLGAHGQSERISVPWGHYLLLDCSSPPPAEGSKVQWTHRGAGNSSAHRINMTKAYKPPNKYHQYSDGSLSIYKVDQKDSGQYFCDAHLVAEVALLTGPAHYTVSNGRTVQLPCNTSLPPTSSERVQWTFSKGGTNSETILTRDERGTVTIKKLGQEHRFSLLPIEPTLVIRDVQPADSGQYLCNSEHAAHLQVVKWKQKRTNESHTVKTLTEMTPAGNTDSSGHSITTEASTDNGDNFLPVCSRCPQSIFHTIYTSLKACGLAAMICAVIVTEIKSTRRGESQAQTGQLPQGQVHSISTVLPNPHVGAV